MFRRDFFRLAQNNFLAILFLRVMTACGAEQAYTTNGRTNDDDAKPKNNDGDDPGNNPGDDTDPGEEEPVEYVTMYDTYAMALYFGGELGPKTGEVLVDYVIANEVVNKDFWHGHGGKQHKFQLLPEHFEQLKQGKKVTIETTEVDGHTHNLFIDPNDPKWRMPGAQPRQVPK